jgi:organic radical activating enzyme
MSDRFFPIKTKTACSLKWSWSTLYLYSGTTASCHRTGISKLTADNFDNFHNTDIKLQDRQHMLNGTWPTDSCGYCKKIEDSGGFSDRMLHLDIPNLYPTELDDDATSININPTILEVYFNNVCNLACLYCLPELSSKINQEHKLFGPFAKDGVILKDVALVDTTLLIDKFWTWLENNSKNLKRLNVLGGEPFYQAEFYKLLDYFESNPHPNLEVCVVTNLMIDTNKLDRICDRLKLLLANKKLKRVDITCSIDCLGDEQEYVRYGLDLALWEQNFELLLSKKWLTLNINQTVSVLTIKTMPELLQKLLIWQKTRPVGHYFSEVTPQPSYLMIDILGNKVFASDVDKILECIPDSTARKYMHGLFCKIQEATPNIKEIQKLKTFLDEKDRRRNTSWKNTFPWLVEVFSCLNDE